MNEADKKAINRRYKKREVRGSLYPYNEHDRDVKQKGDFALWHARQVTRKVLRGVRGAAKEGTLKLGPRTEEHDAMDIAKEIEEKKRNREWEQKSVAEKAFDLQKKEKAQKLCSFRMD